MAEDRIYSLPLNQVGTFEFDDQVADVFPDMIRRSVPGYASVLAMTAELAERYARPATNIYDLGCSLGAASLLIRERVPSSCVIHAIDSSPSMVSKLRQRIARQSTETGQIEVHEADIQAIPISNASFAVMNYTLQFIAPADRQECLQRVSAGLIQRGALVLSEKVSFSDPAQHALMTELHHSFKRANGYSDLEIAQKRTALEKTLIAETTETHVTRLQSVGFAHVSLWFQCFNFVSILAVK